MDHHLVDTCFARLRDAIAPSSNEGEDLTEQLKQAVLAHGPKPTLLTRAALPKLENGAMVTFRGLVQDMFDPELFCLSYNAGRSTGLLRDSVPLAWNEDKNRLGEREVLYLVPVPGESTWVKHMVWSQRELASPAATTGTSEEEARMQVVEESKSTSFKRMRQEAKDGGSAPLVVEDDENLPYPDAEFPPCIIKLYSNAKARGGDARMCKLQDVVIVTGLLSLEYLPCDNADEYESRDCLPSNLAPRIHVLSLEFQDALLPLFASPAAATAMSPRNLCLKLLEDALGGDALAAEFALLWAVSSAENEVVGRLALGLARVPPATALRLLSLLPLLVTRTQTYALQDLNTTRLAPSKDVKRNRLVAGALQVGGGTRIVLNETSLREGERLNELAMQNIQHLQLLAKSQQVEYDFHGFQRFQTVDAPLLILSQMRPVAVPPEALDAVVNLQQQQQHAGGYAAAVAQTPPLLLLPHQESMAACQAYLERTREGVKLVELPEEIAKRVEDDFVLARQENAMGKISDKDLHVWLNLAKLTCASLGRTQVTLEDYSRARILEEERRKRV